MVAAIVVEVSKMVVVASVVVEEGVVGMVCVDTIETIMTAAKTPKSIRKIDLFDVVCKQFNSVVLTFELSWSSLLALFACRFCNHSDLSRSRGTFPVLLKS